MESERKFVHYRHNGWREVNGECQLILSFPSVDRLVDYVKINFGDGDAVIMSASPADKQRATKQFVLADLVQAEKREIEDRLLAVEHIIADPTAEENTAIMVLPE